MKNVLYLILLVILLWVLFHSYHYMIAIAIAVKFPVSDAKELFWLTITFYLVKLVIDLLED
jgi:hypothetical protein